MYLESFRHPFQESVHETLHLTQDNIQLILPQDEKSLGYDIVADKRPCEVSIDSHATFINARRMRQRVTVLTLCVCVSVCLSRVCCLQIELTRQSGPSYQDGFRQFFLDFQLIDLSKMPSFPRKSAFHGYFVVSNPHKRLCVLLVAFNSHVEHQCSFYIEHTRMQGYVVNSCMDDRWHLAVWPARLQIFLDLIVDLYTFEVSLFSAVCI